MEKSCDSFDIGITSPHWLYFVFHVLEPGWSTLYIVICQEE